MARQFNGTSQAAQAASVDLSGVNKATVAAWVWINASPASNSQIWEFSSNYNNVTTGFNFNSNVDASTNPEVSLKGDVDYSNADYALWSTAAWHHCVAIYNKSLATDEPSFYLDGVLQTIIAGNHTANNTNNFLQDTLNFAARNAASNWWGGRLAEIGVWNVILSGANITSLAGTLGVANSAALPSSIPTGLKGYWAFLGTTSPEPDTSGAGHDATLTGTPPQATHPIEPNYAVAGTEARRIIITRSS